MQKEIIVGRVSGVYGIQGWVKIHSFTAPVDNILRYSPWELRPPKENKPVRVTVADSRKYKNGCLVRFDLYRDRDATLGLVGSDIVISRDQLLPTDTQEYYWADLVGCRVVARDGTDLGQVVWLIETGANDVLVVAGERERLIPFTSEVILAVDPARRVIYVDWDTDF
ncbi:MAG: 16S rRNA processing protein RimM [Candidatus Kentron sp. G]|nr:MAG: 16S rRNA processing protein RimM [Candidatus Kentron sp. G]VFN00752.1 MAG: 16S rRNA processing protein RimM [Candidatus Kentron sp. G]VFN02715.1 MAG: 16S rRNA processing protein RimM [Candidatus Kentron sp. G]